MKTNKLSLKLLKYEIMNASTNMFTLIFGIAFPIFLSALFSFIFSSEVPKEELLNLNTSLFITMMLLPPLATMFIGYAANYSQEIESGALQRFKLFGYKENTLLIAKLISNLLFLTFALIVYCIVMLLILDIKIPEAGAFILLIVIIYALATVLLILSHAIASIMKRFGPTYGVTMALYFAFMTFGGMMGISPEKFPPFLNAICRALPMYYINVNYIDYWNGGSFDFLPLCLSLIGLGVVACGLLLLSIWLNKKGNTGKYKEKGIYWD